MAIINGYNIDGWIILYGFNMNYIGYGYYLMDIMRSLPIIQGVVPKAMGGVQLESAAGDV